jgi:autotransporter-associated beta strand protein
MGGPLTTADIQAYKPADASTLEAGPLALYTVAVDSILPTQMNEGFAEVDAKAAGYDLFTNISQVETDLLSDTEPVVIGPNGQLYLLDGHHTFTALIDSVWGASDPTVYVNVIANYSSDDEQQFIAQMEANNWLLPLNDDVPQTVNPLTGSPIPTSLTGLTNDVYRGLEYSILKNKDSKLFTNSSNITGAAGTSTPGLDKMPGLYSDFVEAAAYQDADSGLGLPFLSPGDIALASQWNLTATSATTLPNVSGTVLAAQIPGFILSDNLVEGTGSAANTIYFNPNPGTGGITDATLNETRAGPLDANGDSESGALAGNGTFTGITEINAGTVANPIYLDTPNVGFVLQLGNDNGFSVTLTGTNTYTGGTTFLAGRLIVDSDASLGALPTESASALYNSLTFDAEGLPDNVTAAVQADNGIIFNSLSEGNATLTIGTSAGEYTLGGPLGAFMTSRPIAVGNEAATIDVNGNYVELNGPLLTLGYDNLGIGETAGFPALTIDDLSSGGGKTATAGTLILSTPSPYFYGDIIIGNVGTPTVDVMSDAALGYDGSNPELVGTVELNGGTLQTGASFSASERSMVLDGSSQIDVDGNTTSWGTLTDVKRTIAIVNSSETAGAITFNSLTISQTATLQLDGSANGTTYSGAETVTFTNGIVQSAGQDTLFIDPSTTLGTTEEVFSSGASTMLVNGIAPVWMITDSGGGASTNPYNFLTYGANGYVIATYTDTGSGSTGGIRTATSTSIVDQSGNGTLSANAQAYALKVNDGAVITATGHTITLGDGTDPAGLIMGGGSAAITGGTLAFGGSEAFIYAKGTSTISAEITGSNGLVLAGSGTLQVSTAAALSGRITLDSGELSLTAANIFSTDVAGLTLQNVKSSPAPSTLNFTANQTFTTLNSSGTDSTITFSNSATLTIGDTTNNLSSTLSAAITETGGVTAGALTFDGSGLFDLSGMSSGTLNLVTGSTIVVNNSAELRVAASEFKTSTFGVDLNGTNTQLQFAQGGGGQFANAITGTGELHLIGGTLQLTGINNTYSGGTVVELGSTLDLTTANVTSSAAAGAQNITDAGGLIVFDQDFVGTYSGVISDGKQMGTGPMESGSLDIDNSTNNSGSGVELTAAQAYSGATYIEAGTLTLDATNAIADSSGLTLGRVGGAIDGQTAGLQLLDNNTLASLSSDTGNTTSVVLNGNTLTLDPGTGISSTFGGTISDGSSGGGGVVIDGAGTVTFTGSNSYSGNTNVEDGTLVIDGTNGNSAITVDNGAAIGGTGTAGAVTVDSGGTFTPGDPSTFTVASLTLSSGSAFDEEIGGTSPGTGGAGGYDQTVVESGGTIGLGGATLNVSLVDGFTPSVGDSFTIINNDTGNAVGGTFAGLSQGATFNLDGDVFQISYDGGSNGQDVTLTEMPCYCPGTLIATEHGEVPVEELAIGDKVMTKSGEARPIKWIGRRSYGGRFTLGRKDILPVCIKPGALADNVPKRDLWISPNHAMYLDGVLIEARDLINGTSIVQAERVETVQYIHIELDCHDVIIAEGALAESFIDDDGRGLFHNAHEYRALYPDATNEVLQYCAPRLRDGYELEAARRRIALRAGLLAPDQQARVGSLRGFVDLISPGCIAGWAQSTDHPGAPVCLDIYVDGELIAQTLANRYRSDLKRAGIGDGRHSFEFKPPAGMIIAAEVVEVQRSLDGAVLQRSACARAAA